jgi:hypothetical protein
VAVRDVRAQRLLESAIQRAAESGASGRSAEARDDGRLRHPGRGRDGLRRRAPGEDAATIIGSWLPTTCAITTIRPGCSGTWEQRQPGSPGAAWMPCETRSGVRCARLLPAGQTGRSGLRNGPKPRRPPPMPPGSRQPGRSARAGHLGRPIRPRPPALENLQKTAELPNHRPERGTSRRNRPRRPRCGP